MSNSNLINLAELFKGSIFRVPDYQRGYAWGERQLEDFWEDLVNLPMRSKHYTGMLALQEVQNDIASTWIEEGWLVTKGGATSYYVVDGQQRLTTFVIFIQCFIDYIRSKPDNVGKKDWQIEVYDGMYRLSEVVSDFIVREKADRIQKAYRFGYEIDNPSFSYLRYGIFGDEHPGKSPETFYTRNLANAKHFFEENINALDENDGQGAVEETFHKAITMMLFNVYDIDSNFDVFTAFETMNNRGKKLSNLELLKSRLIYLSTLLNTDSGVQENLRLNINECWKQVYDMLGKPREQLNDDRFLQDHWTVYYPLATKRGANYARFLLGEEFTVRNIYQHRLAITSGASPEPADEEGQLFDDELPLDDPNDSALAAQVELIDAQRINEYVGSLKETANYWYITHYPREGEISEDE